MFYVPEGFAHGFYVLSDIAEFTYKCTDFYDPSSEAGIKWDDQLLNIKWPIPEGENPLISEKDAKNPKFSEDIFLILYIINLQEKNYGDKKGTDYWM